MESDVSDFLEEKIKACDSKLDFWEDYADGLKEAKDNHSLSDDIYQIEIQRMLKSCEPIAKELGIVKKQRRIILEDLQEEADARKRQNMQSEPDIDFYDRAYTNTIINP